MGWSAPHSEAVLSIPYDRARQVRHVRADLIAAAGLQATFDQGVTIVAAQRGVLGDRQFPGATRDRPHDAVPAFAQPRLDATRGRIRSTTQKGEIDPLGPVLSKHLLDEILRRLLHREHEHAGDIFVEPMHRVHALAKLPTDLIGHREAGSTGRMNDQHARRLRHHDEVFVLPEDRDVRHADDQTRVDGIAQVDGHATRVYRRRMSTTRIRYLLTIALSAIPIAGQVTQKADSRFEDHYFPPRFDWATKQPEKVGMDPDKLAAAIAFAKQSFDPKGGFNASREPYPETIGPT